MKGLLVAFFVVLCAVCAQADSLSNAAPSVVLPDTYTVATLPDPTKNQARYAFVTDLGGGADMVLSDGANWKHIRQGVVTDVPAAASIPVTPLASPPIIRLTSTSLLSLAMTVNVSATNLYPGYTIHFVVPNGVLGTGASLGVSVGGGSSLPLLGGTWEDVMWNGSTLIEIGRGTL